MLELLQKQVAKGLETSGLVGSGGCDQPLFLQGIPKAHAPMMIGEQGAFAVISRVTGMFEAEQKAVFGGVPE